MYFFYNSGVQIYRFVNCCVSFFENEILTTCHFTSCVFKNLKDLCIEFKSLKRATHLSIKLPGEKPSLETLFVSLV